MKTKNDIDVLVIGAGASGLMAARELSKAGKKVLVLEARDRVGGRIWPLSKKEFGYPAQGGGEFVHGPAKVTKSLIKAAALTYVPMQGQRWGIRNGQLVRTGFYMPYQDELGKRLKAVKKDIPVATFLNKYFSAEKYNNLRTSVTRMLEGFDAADSKRASIISVRDEWLGEGIDQQGRIKEGYGPLLDFLVAECKKYGAEIVLNQNVASVALVKGGVNVRVGSKTYFAKKVIVTLALPTLSSLRFTPALPSKMRAAKKIGYGGAIKIVLRFKTRWWLATTKRDLRKMDFLIGVGDFGTWWTQYPERYPALVGWLAGPSTGKFKNVSDAKILDVGLSKLAEIFKVNKNFVKKQLTNAKVANWPADPLAQGAYSYTSVEAKAGYKELRKPVKNTIYFAGEALADEEITATVDGALSSGKDVATLITKK